MKKKVITIVIVALAVVLTGIVLVSKMVKQRNSEITIAESITSNTQQDATNPDDKKSEETKKVTELKTGSGAIDLSTFSVGDLVSFGYYPQTKVTDSDRIDELDNLDKDWESYEYYVGDGGYCNGKMESKDFMYYCDLSLKGSKYRAVTFSSYRPSSTDKAFTIGLSTNEKGSDKDTANNGYLVGYVYYFKFEPIVWRVLDPDEGFVVCESIIDCQPFQNFVTSSEDPVMPGSKAYGTARRTYFASDWSNSSLRKWLNEDFYELAFNEKQRDLIAESEISTKAYNEEEYTVKRDSTDDKIFILSYSEATNDSYGFSSKSDADASRALKGTDYAKCQGLEVVAQKSDDKSDVAGSSPWIMRTPADYMRISFCDESGKIGDSDWIEVTNCKGICPAMKFNAQEQEES